MICRITLVAAIVAAFAVSLAAQRQLELPLRPESTPFWRCERIVSTAPSITETLYALGLGDRVVGVTRFCEFPPEVKHKPQIGGYYDPNFEAIVALRPDLVIMLEEQAEAVPAFAKLKLETLVILHKTIAGVIDSFRTIGRVCGRGPEGRQMAAEFERRLAVVEKKTKDLPRPRVLGVLDRTFGNGKLADVYVVGDDSYLDTMIQLAGGQNAYQQRGIRYPTVSTEGLLSLNPDVIVDLVPKTGLEQLSRDKLVADWNQLHQVAAVRNRRVLVFDQTYACVPGPRFLQFVEALARALHPEVDWDDSKAP